MSASANREPFELVEGHQYDGFKVSVEVRKPERRGYYYGRTEDDGVEFEFSKVYADPKEAARAARQYYDQYISQFVFFVYEDDFKPGDSDYGRARLREIQAQHRGLITAYDTNARKDYKGDLKKKKATLTLKFERDQSSVQQDHVGRAFVELTIVRAVAVLTLEELPY